ncbi:hypothetical protein EZV62_009167 [Acer yangbiense]|uniref:PGG domain-containing protein n=1 Tax=Acer yangbiense TaxID=1000413 RepID=A0A5C7IGA6_9ROSI|nr:hypothetical protein EZV62_009167 [Acer yangbiense]
MDPDLRRELKCKNVNGIMKLAKEKPDLFWGRSPQGNTTLHIASRSGNKSVVQAIIKIQPCLIYERNQRGETPLHIAAAAGDVNVVKLLFDVTMEILNARKDLVTKEDVKQRNALHYAAALFSAYEVEKIVALLSKEDVLLAYKRDCNGQTPIHLATINGRFSVVKMLVNDYPDVIEMLDNNQRNILHLAAQHGHGDIVSFILKLPEKDDLLNTLDEEGNTPLHLAAMNFHDNVVDTLCRQMKLNIMAINHKDQTALKIAQKSEVEATENKKCLTLKALKETYKYQTLDPEDIIANGCLSGSGTSTTDDQGKIKRAKKLAEVILMLTSIVAAFTFTAALTIPEKFNYPRDPEQNGKLRSIHFQLNKGDCFLFFMIFTAMSSASCLSAAIIICCLFCWASNHHEYFIKRLSTAVFLTIMGLISMALAFIFGLFVVLTSNHTIPMRFVWVVSILPLIFLGVLPIYPKILFPRKERNPYVVD